MSILDKKKYRIVCEVELPSYILVGEDEKGNKQTLEEVLNTLSGSTKFSNVEIQSEKL